MNPKDKNDKTPLERCEEHLQLVAGQDDPEFESLVNQDPEVKFWYDQLPQIIKAVEKVSEDRIREEIRAAHDFWQTGAEDPDEAWEEDVMMAMDLTESDKIRSEIHQIKKSTEKKEPVIRSILYRRVMRVAAIVLMAIVGFWGYQRWNADQQFKNGLLTYDQFIRDDIEQLGLQGIGMENPILREQLSEVLKSFGNDPSRDLEQLNAMIDQGSDMDEAYFYKAIALARLKQYDEALSTLDKIKEESLGCKLPFYRALIHRMNGDKNALMALRNIPNQYPDCPLMEAINQLIQ
ncbi:MAG: hypothetical protein KDC59_00425 [Saprospiraceae bacterium]|nr:hypothetical protein [Saprospiraceae bacterium]HPG05373.1 hypothetical protein [Saprospiraceae bacterium]